MQMEGCVMCRDGTVVGTADPQHRDPRSIPASDDHVECAGSPCPPTLQMCAGLAMLNGP